MVESPGDKHDLLLLYHDGFHDCMVPYPAQHTMETIMYYLVLLIGAMLFTYLVLGVAMAWDEIHPGRRLFLTLFWIFTPALAKKSREIAEAMEPIPFEGVCVCRKRDIRDAGKKWCSACGGKIKDTLWKRR